MHSRGPYTGPTPRSYFDGLSTSDPSPTPLDPSTWLRVSGPPGMDSGSGAGMTEGVGGWDGMLVLKGFNAGERWASTLDSSGSLGMTG